MGPWLPAWQDDLGRWVLDSTDSRMLMMCARFALAKAVNQSVGSYPEQSAGDLLR